jgi:hypothetical protein
VKRLSLFSASSGIDKDAVTKLKVNINSNFNDIIERN